MGNAPLGARHIWVNQPDFVAKVVDDGKVTFKTRVVIGKVGADTESPEFSDVMEYMVVNPTWSVPRSIVVKEYLPMLKRNANAQGQLQVIDGSGRVVPRSAINFAAYSEKTFPFACASRHRMAMPWAWSSSCSPINTTSICTTRPANPCSTRKFAL